MTTHLGDDRRAADGELGDRSGTRSDGRPRRLAALDMARGLMLVVSLVVNSWFTAPSWFAHAPWVGVHPEDLVFPAFVTLSGAGLGILYSREVRTRREIRRIVVLFAAGLGYTAWVQHVAGGLVWSEFRVTGVLQLYAVVVAAMLLLSRVATSWWQWLCAGAGVATLHTAVIGAFALGCPGATLTRTCNPSGAWEVQLLGAHAYATGLLGHDPEGLFGIAGALVCACVGAAGARLVLDHRRDGSLASLLRRSVVVVTVCGVGAVAASQVVPPFKRLWTAPFALQVAGVVTAAFVLLHLALDLRPVGRLEVVARYPVVALGRNSLLVYFGSHAVMAGLVLLGPEGRASRTSPSWATSWSGRLADAVGATGAMWPWCVAVVLAWTVLAVLLHRLRIYVKA